MLSGAIGVIPSLQNSVSNSTLKQAREVTVPTPSAVCNGFGKVDFCDAYQVPVQHTELTAQAMYCAIFLHSPKWVQRLMDVRSVVAKCLGLQHDFKSKLLDPTVVAHTPWVIGRRLGPFIVQAVHDDEVIVGEDDMHLNFRISVLKSIVAGQTVVTVATVVATHNALGRAYMFCIKPFHRLIARAMINNAARAGRL